MFSEGHESHCRVGDCKCNKAGQSCRSINSPFLGPIPVKVAHVAHLKTVHAHGIASNKSIVFAVVPIVIIFDIFVLEFLADQGRRGNHVQFVLVQSIVIVINSVLVVSCVEEVKRITGILDVRRDIDARLREPPSAEF